MKRHPPDQTPMMPLPTKRTKHKRIEAHSDAELDEAIAAAIAHCAEHGLDFYTVLHGIDAYMTRRKRRDDRRHAAESFTELADPWGNS